MNTQPLKKFTACAVILTHVMAYTLPSAQAAPGTLASAPLYLSTAVEPNIMFLLDDSGSMEWEFMAQGANDGIPVFANLPRFYVLPSVNNGRDINYTSPNFPYAVPSVAQVADTWRARTSSFNTLYYNPDITYTPWDGVNATSTPLYTNANPTAAWVNPNNAGAGTLDLTATINFNGYRFGAWAADSVYPAHHYLWTDTDNNGVVDATDANVLVEIRSTIPTYAKASTRNDCTNTPAVCTYAEEIQNFANWYTYYRKRAYAAKKALGNLIDRTSGTRMGLYAYNDGLIRNATSMNTPANKLALLQSTYGARMTCDNTGGCLGTPARTALRDLGNLFEGTSSPILNAASGGTCQQNFSIVATDGYWNGGSPGVGNTDIDGPGPFDGAPYGDNFANTLADVAMHYYERDLKTGLADNVPVTPGIDNATHQHMVTYTVAFGVTGTLNPTTDDPKATGFAWPDPSLGDNQKIDDTWHAAYNGRGLFLSAKDPDKLSTALNSAIANIEERSSSAAAVAFNSTSLNDNSVIYQAKFDPNKWSGDLLAFKLNPLDGKIDTTTPLWNAASQVNAQLPASRVILTYNPTTNLGIPFTWDPSTLSITQQNDLNMGVAVADNRGSERVDYLRGDRSNEGSATLDFRKRSSSTVLGDIAHSNPVFVGQSNLAYPDTAPFPTGTNAYSAFKTSQSSRQGVIYVGANDGMLHGFDALTGQEVLAYIPHNLFSANTGTGLHFLTEKTYTHRYYVDLGVTVSDAYTTSVAGGTVGWKTVLVGSERGGGRGLFALDITSPSAFSQTGSAPDNIVMWEFTHADLGYTYSKPAIVLMNNGRWAAVFGNGYNDTGDGKAKLFIVYLDGGVDGVWTPGTDFVTITTNVGSTTARNGLAAPNMVDLNGDKVVDRIYVGDLFGNMWVFDVSGSTSASWDVAYKTGTTPKPLFTAINAAGAIQPITSRPTVAKHVSVANSGSNIPNLMVYFGTGQYIAIGDTSTTATQTFYGVWDNGTKSLLRTNLVPQTFTAGAAMGTRVLTNTTVTYTGSSAKYGWYIDLDRSNAATGERVVVDPLVRGNEVYFNTMIPASSPCSFGGSGWAMRVNRDNGGPPTVPVFDANNDGFITSVDNKINGQFIGNGIMTESKILGDKVYTSLSDGSINVSPTPPVQTVGAGRQSWREVIR